MRWLAIWVVGFYVACAISAGENPEEWGPRQWAVLLLWPGTLLLLSGMLVAFWAGDFRKWRGR